jgi:hypothetical protein
MPPATVSVSTCPGTSWLVGAAAVFARPNVGSASAVALETAVADDVPARASAPAKARLAARLADDFHDIVAPDDSVVR